MDADMLSDFYGSCVDEPALEKSGLGALKAAAAAHAKAVLELETALAEASMPIVDRREPPKLYHRLERQGLKMLAPPGY